MGRPDIVWQRGFVHRESVILAGYLDLSREVVPHRVVRAPVPELQLGGRGACGQGKQLMPQTDPEDRQPPDEALDSFNTSK